METAHRRSPAAAAAALLVALTGCGPAKDDPAADGGGGGDAAASADARPGDSDGDGIRDDDEGRWDPSGPRDSDGDGTPDYLDPDSDNDGLSDADEGAADWDGDGVPNYVDPLNDGDPAPVLFTALTTSFNQPIGIDYHEPTNSVVMSVNYPTGSPLNFERVEADGSHQPFSGFSGLTEEVKIATVRSGNQGGFVTGDLFVGNGIDGQIVRITDGGATISNPWVDLPGDGNGLMRGSMFVDRSNLFGGELVAVTTTGQVWQISAAGVPAPILAAVGTHLEGALIVPDYPARYGPLAGKLIAGAEEVGLLYAITPAGVVTSYSVGVAIEDIDLIPPKENFFGVNFGTSTLIGAQADQFRSLAGDILLTQESPTGGSSLFRLQWNGSELVAQEIPVADGSATLGQWEHTTFAPAGVAEIPPVE